MIVAYGYVAVFLGTFLEGETILVIAGILASKGYLSLGWVVIAAFFGTLTGDQLFFYIGRFHANRFLEKRPGWNSKIDKVRRIVEGYSTLVIFGFRFLYGLRAVSPFAIGMSRVPIRKFVTLNVIGAAFWTITVAFSGYLFGQAIEAYFDESSHYRIVVMVVAVALISLAWGLGKFLTGRRKKSAVAEYREQD